MGEVRNGDQKVRKYLFPEIFYGRQEVHKYFRKVMQCGRSSTTIKCIGTTELAKVFQLILSCMANLHGFILKVKNPLEILIILIIGS